MSTCSRALRTDSKKNSKKIPPQVPVHGAGIGAVSSSLLRAGAPTHRLRAEPQRHRSGTGQTCSLKFPEGQWMVKLSDEASVFFPTADNLSPGFSLYIVKFIFLFLPFLAEFTGSES